MFFNTDFNKDISTWHLNTEADIDKMFQSCAIHDNYKPKK